MTLGLYTRLGMRALRNLARSRSALVFDLDGTLAPIVMRPADARVPERTATRLRALSSRWPVAVVTGRSVDDAAGRLGFEPKGLYGNHGAHRLGAARQPSSLTFERELDAVRAGLHRQTSELHRRRIELEDKGLSLALHYRASPQPDLARAYLHDVLRPHLCGLRVEDGHCVVNLMPAAAPDKGDALREVLDDWALDCALVVGDDSNDEAAFAAAPPGSVSVRIGATERPTAAQFTLAHQTEVDALLDLLLRFRPATRAST